MQKPNSSVRTFDRRPARQVLANNKNQHFVPRCHLKPFTLGGEGLAINLFNLARRQLIKNAPVKHQCSRDYFYGRNTDLEESIQSLEAEYANVVRRICADSSEIEDQDARFLSRFWIFQHLRTEAIQKSILRQTSDLRNVVGNGLADLTLGKKEATLIALSAFAKNTDAIGDLKMVLVRSRCSVSFLTSDNPAVQTNRWALLNSGRGVATFGMHSAGAIALLPIAPRLLAMMYDKDVYSVAHDGGVVSVRDIADIRALNEHQLLNCAVNLYLSPECDQEDIGEFPELSDRRASSGPRIHVFQKKTAADHKFHSTKEFDRSKGTEALLVTPTYYASPTTWPSFLRWRTKGFYFENGSGVGSTREAWIDKVGVTKPFRKKYTGR